MTLGATFELVEYGWLFMGITTGIHHFSEVFALGEQTQASWVLVLGFVATGVGLLGTKLLDIYQKYRQINSDSDFGRLRKCREEIELLKQLYEERLKSKASAVLFAEDQITRLHDVVNAQAGTIAKLSSLSLTGARGEAITAVEGMVDHEPNVSEKA